MSTQSDSVGKSFLQAWAAAAAVARPGPWPRKRRRRQNVWQRESLYRSDDHTDKAATEYRQVKEEIKGTSDAKRAVLRRVITTASFTSSGQNSARTTKTPHEGRKNRDYIKIYAEPVAEAADSYFNLALIGVGWAQGRGAITTLITQRRSERPKVYLGCPLVTTQQRTDGGYYNSAQWPLHTRADKQRHHLGEIVAVLRDVVPGPQGQIGEGPRRELSGGRGYHPRPSRERKLESKWFTLVSE